MEHLNRDKLHPLPPSPPQASDPHPVEYPSRESGHPQNEANAPQDLDAQAEAKASADSPQKPGTEAPQGLAKLEPPGEPSPLAQAIHAYLERNPDDASEPPGWIGRTLWAYSYYPGEPAAATEITAAIEELGGRAYLQAWTRGERA